MTRPIQLFRTARDTTDRLAEQPPLAFQAELNSALPPVIVDTGARYQVIEGFGGSFTEAAATTLHKMSPERQIELLRAYFDPQKGHGYTLCRTHINSCDFSLGNYAYTEVPGDVNLEHFDIERDHQVLIPMIKAAQKVSPEPIKLLASPWSPPAWMKTNGQMNHGGKLKPEYREAWARYYCRYIQEYENAGIPIWGLTVQNEPEAKQVWDSCLYTAEEERDFVRDYLGPALEQADRSDVRLIVWDHNRDVLFERAKGILDDPEAAKYVWGVGFHWYVADCFDNVRLVHEAYPDKKLIFTEGCQEGGPHLGSWLLGERYARSMINDLNRWTVGWVDWNMVLDERGGPNHVGNYCSAPIIADTHTDTLYYQSSYYYIGHFSRYIRPGAVGVLCASARDELEATAFLNPDGHIALVVLNRSEQRIPFVLKYNGAAVETESPPRSIQTYRFAAG